MLYTQPYFNVSWRSKRKSGLAPELGCEFIKKSVKQTQRRSQRGREAKRERQVRERANVKCATESSESSLARPIFRLTRSWDPEERAREGERKRDDCQFNVRRWLGSLARASRDCEKTPGERQKCVLSSVRPLSPSTSFSCKSISYRFGTQQSLAPLRMEICKKPVSWKCADKLVIPPTESIPKRKVEKWKEHRDGVLTNWTRARTNK